MLLRPLPLFQEAHTAATTEKSEEGEEEDGSGEEVKKTPFNRFRWHFGIVDCRCDRFFTPFDRCLVARKCWQTRNVLSPQ